MPGVDGLDAACAQYRADPATKDIPIIVLSTQGRSGHQERGVRAGANDYLVKLPDRIELVARIRHPLEGLPQSAAARRGLSRAPREPAQLVVSNTELIALNQKLEEATQRQVGVSGAHEPRDPHADERRARHDDAAARHGAHRRAARIRRDRSGSPATAC